MANRIQLRRDTAANWTRVNPVLEDGEPGLEIDTNRVKYGDGNTTWANLSYSGGGSASFDYSTVQEGSSGPNNITSITGGDETGVSLTSENWAQLMWVPNTANVTIADIGDGPATYSWAFVDDEGFHVEASVDEVKREWRFTTDGNLELPLGGKIGEVPSPTFVGNAVVITPADGTDDNQQLMIYPTQNEGNHLHMTSGNLAVTDIFLGDDYQYIRTRTDQGMTIGTGGGEMWSGNAWTFGANGILSTPGNVQIGSLDSYGNISFVDTISANSYVYANGVSILSGLGGGATDRLTNGASEVVLQANGVTTFGNTATISNNGEFRIWADNDITVYRNGQDGYAVKSSSIENYTDNTQRTVVNSNGLEIKTGNLIIPNNKAVVYANGVSILDGVTGTYGNTNVAAYLAGSVTTGNLTVGNLIVNGNSSIINTESYVISDNIIQMANANPADTLDLGFIAHRTVDSTLEHTGLVRDADAGIWRLFSNVTAQPGSTVDFTNANYDVLQVGGLNTVTITATGPLNFTASPPAFSTPGIQWNSGFQTDIYGNTQVAAYLVANPQGNTYSNTNVASYLSSSTLKTVANLAVSGSAPSSVTGSAGDTAGMIRVDSNYVYYCTSTFSPNSYTVGWGGAVNNTLFLTQGDYPTPQVGWTVSQGGNDFTIDTISDTGYGSWQITWVGTPYGSPTGGTATLTNPSPASIWKTVPLSAFQTAVNSTYSNANVVANLQNFVTSISTTANIRTTANVIAPNFLFANGVNILSTVSGGSSYANANAAAYLLTYVNANVASLNATSGNITTLVTTNFSTANAVISGGYATGLANITVTSGGNIAGVGNIIGSTANTTITAGAYTSSFLNNGVMTTANVVASGNISALNFTGNGYQLTSVATKVLGSWTLAAGANTVNITVPGPGTYSLWVNGNIPNGICTYTATVVVTNNNVPVLGSQYAWYYLAGNMLEITSIPGQIVGTANAIITTAPSTTTANVFEFGITNNSGASCTVDYGYTKLS